MRSDALNNFLLDSVANNAENQEVNGIDSIVNHHILMRTGKMGYQRYESRR